MAEFPAVSPYRIGPKLSQPKQTKINPYRPQLRILIKTGAIMQIVTLYLSTAVFFLAVDAVMLKNVMRPLFETRINHLLLDDLRIGPAAIFYLFYVGGLLWFVSLPALRAGAPMQALWNGALMGALAYGTYEFTNYATLKDWAPKMVAVDLVWGMVLTGVSAFVGVVITQALVKG